jgi:hypothetical protein
MRHTGAQRWTITKVVTPPHQHGRRVRDHHRAAPPAASGKVDDHRMRDLERRIEALELDRAREVLTRSPLERLLSIFR